MFHLFQVECDSFSDPLFLLLEQSSLFTASTCGSDDSAFLLLSLLFIHLIQSLGRCFVEPLTV